MDLISERLVYHKITIAEISDYMRWYMNDEVMKYITGRGLTRQEAQARFEKVLAVNEKHPEVGFYSVKIKKETTFIGIAKLVHVTEEQAEVGYGSLPEFWGQKYASEMLRCLVHYAKEIPQIKELMAVVHPENAASIKILTNQNFTLYETAFEDSNPAEYYRLDL
jgi:RimJ/RimL family protein N-acetyltransferase